MKRPGRTASHAEYVAWCHEQLVAMVPTWNEAQLCIARSSRTSARPWSLRLGRS